MCVYAGVAVINAPHNHQTGGRGVGTIFINHFTHKPTHTHSHIPHWRALLPGMANTGEFARNGWEMGARMFVFVGVAFRNKLPPTMRGALGRVHKTLQPYV